jgi:hypothetical protein
MAAKTAPGVGEIFLDNGVRYLKVTFGGSGVADVPLSAAVADSDTLVVTPIFSWGGGGMNLLGISTRVVTAFKAGSTISLGTDSMASASSATSLMIAEVIGATVVVANQVNTSWAGDGTSATGCIGGLFYSTSGVIELHYTAADSDELATGVLEIGLLYTYGA